MQTLYLQHVMLFFRRQLINFCKFILYNHRKLISCLLNNHLWFFRNMYSLNYSFIITSIICNHLRTFTENKWNFILFAILNYRNFYYRVGLVFTDRLSNILLPVKLEFIYIEKSFFKTFNL